MRLSPQESVSVSEMEMALLKETTCNAGKPIIYGFISFVNGNFTGHFIENLRIVYVLPRSR